MNTVHVINTMAVVLIMALSVMKACVAEPEHTIEQGEKQARNEPASPSHHTYYSKSRAVVIGINKYQKWSCLEYAVNDAEAVEERLRELGFEEIYTLIDSQATRENIVRLLGDELPRKVKNDERLLIFFAGHGQTEEVDGRQQGYIIPADGDLQYYYSTAISMNQVREFSSRISAKHIYYVIDACYSGLGLLRSGPAAASGTEGYLKKVTSARAVQMITAGGKGEQVSEEGKHGLFTLYFLKAIAGEADFDNDGVVTASEIGTYTRPKVSRYSRNQQTPQFGILSGEGEFVFLLPHAEDSSVTSNAGQEQERRLKDMRQKEEALRIWEEMLKRQTSFLENKEGSVDGSEQNEVEPRKRSQEDGSGQGKHEKDHNVTGFFSDKPVVKFRASPKILTTHDIRNMLQEKGLRDVEWNPGGDFANEYEEKSIDGQKIVIDHASGLVWQQSGSSAELNREAAGEYINRLNTERFAGISQWRLPTIEEIATLLEPLDRDFHYIDHVFDQKQQWCWSADKKPSGEAWAVAFRTGVLNFPRPDGKYYVRCVFSPD